MKLFTVAQMVGAEKAADAAGHSYAEMMARAGRGVAEAITARQDVAGKSVLVLVGPGNNGGDGLVAGRYLAAAGADVAFYLTNPRDPQQDANFAQVQQMGLFVLEASLDQRFRVLRTRLAITDILIDALLGTGVSRPITGTIAQLLKHVQSASQHASNDPGHLVTLSPLHPSSLIPHPYIVAVDCPSGLNCDTGELDEAAVSAQLTVTFAGPKYGHFRFPGAAACGELVVVDIGIDENLPAVKDVPTDVATAVLAQTLLPKRPRDGHKGTFGNVLIAAGCDPYRGAPVLAARGAFRSGAGLVALAVPDVLRQSATIQLAEATFVQLTAVAQLDAAAAQTILDALDGHDALLVGPGMGDARDFMAALLDGLPDDAAPLLVDADGLNVLSGWGDWWHRLPPGTVLTPHPGEMARLMNIPLNDLKTQNRIDVARRQAQKWGHVVLLKGAFTVVAAPNGRCTVIPFASPVLAVGGSGDVLSGVIATLLGQGLAAYEAAVLGAYLHGLVGQRAPQQSGLLAHEIADGLPAAISLLRA